MKRKIPEFYSALIPGDIRQLISKEQLAEIGAVTLIWNAVEYSVHYLLGIALRIPLSGLTLELGTRINGFDGRIELIRLAIAGWEFPTISPVLATTLGGAKEYKGYRDAVVHSLPYMDEWNQMGSGIRRQGQTYEVLIGVEALSGLYERLDSIRSEIWELMGALYYFDLGSQSAPKDANRSAYLEKLSSSPEIQGHVAQAQEHQKKRRFLPPLPKFPFEHPTPEAKATQ